MPRLFAALPLPASATDRLETLQKGLPGRRPEASDMHLTLAFFGEIDAAQAADLHAALGAVRAQGFAFWLDGAGAFGGAKPRAVYAAVRPEPALTHLHEKVTQAARSAGLRLDARRFVPHVTLARLKPGEMSPAEAAKALGARAAFLAGPVAAEAFGLYRSDLGRRGPRYEELARYPLRAAA